MKHLDTYKAFLEYNSDIWARQNDILDKISRVGIDNITPEEKHFLNSMKDKDSAEKALADYNSQFYNETFKSDDGLYTFNLTSITSEDTDTDDGIITSYNGTMTLSNNNITESYEGSFQLNEMGLYMADFYDGDNNIEDSKLFNDNDYHNFLHVLSMDVTSIKLNK